MIKVSNQITITEHKKITKIEEWYLATNKSSGITTNTSGWSTTVPTINSTNKYLWNYEKTIYSLGESDVTEPVIIGVYGETGSSGASLHIKYKKSKTMPTITNNNVNDWQDTVPEQSDGYNIYMTQKLSTESNWSTPIQISGSKGDAGVDGANIEYVYYRKNDGDDIDAPKYENGTLTDGWTQSPQGITSTLKYEFVSVRVKPAGSSTWGSFSDPVIWSKWGEKGQDGDGIEYKYYLSTSSNKPTYPNGNYTWTDDPQGVSEDWPYEYVVQIKKKSNGEIISTSGTALWAKYGERGSSLQVKYKSSATKPTITNNNVSGWVDTIPAQTQGNKVYMTQKLSSESNWSDPIQISSDAPPTVNIVNGYWTINGESTGVKATGADGSTPTITIGKNGNWYINNKDTGSKAQGEAGKDGADIEYVYTRNNTGNVMASPEYDQNGKLPERWTDSPRGISETERYEFVSVRTKPSGGVWGKFSTPAIWSKWGDKGQDGDGVEYKYYLSNSSNKPTYSATNTKWTDDPKGVTKDNQYEYVVQIKTSGGKSTPSAVALWAKYGDDGVDGKDGKGISSIKNYYAVTESPDSPPAIPEILPNDDWKETVPELTPTNKYLWNFEIIIYTDNSKTTTDPAIIGVYGDSGTDAVDFQIYSTDGFEFSDSLKSIKLNTAAFQGGTRIESKFSYKWYYKDKGASSFSLTETFPDANYSVEMTDARNGRQIYCVVTDQYDNSVKSDIAIIGMQGRLDIVEQPTNSYAKIGDEVSTTVLVSGEVASYKWYVKDPGETTWTVSAVVGKKYQCEMAAPKNGRQVYCVITDKNGKSVTTNTVTLSTPPITITEQPTDVTVSNGSTARVTFTASGSNLQYEWYYKSNNGITFEKTDTFTSNSYTAEMNSDRNGRQVYCVVTDSNGYSVKTNVVTISMSGAVKITRQPASAQVEEGQNATVSISAQGSGLTYKWYYKERGTNTYFLTTAFTGNTYSVPMTAARSGRQLYCVVTDSSGNSVTSSVATIKIKPPTVTIEPSSVCVETGDVATVGVEASNVDVKYTWKWWNKGSESDQYETIAGATGPSLVVGRSKPYALTSIKCEMEYDGIVYEDYVSLTKKTETYTAVAKFFDGDNILETDDVNSLVYIELYKDNELLEELGAKEAYKHEANIISGNYIITNISGSNGEKKYFICYNSTKKYYDVVLGQYATSNSKWTLIKNNYVYKNSFNGSTHQVMYVPKEKINRTLNINFTVCDDDDNVLAITHTRVVDLNDPIVSNSAPANPQKGQMWLDTSLDPDILKVWDGSKWVNSNYQKGNIVHTSMPTSYSKGDLWILATGETCGDFGAGCMLRANTTYTLTASDNNKPKKDHWEDVDAEATEQKKNINQYFDFSKDTGLKIGQSDENFYVNISSTEMGFYDAQDGTPEKVVSISNKSAAIKDLTVEDGASFNCEVGFGKFVWKVESDGSLSLSL